MNEKHDTQTNLLQVPSKQFPDLKLGPGNGGLGWNNGFTVVGKDRLDRRCRPEAVDGGGRLRWWHKLTHELIYSILLNS